METNESKVGKGSTCGRENGGDELRDEGGAQSRSVETGKGNSGNVKKRVRSRMRMYAVFAKDGMHRRNVICDTVEHASVVAAAWRKRYKNVRVVCFSGVEVWP